MRFHPLIQNSSRYFSRLKRVCHTQTLTSIEHHIHISSLHSQLWVQLSAGSAFSRPVKNGKFLRFFNIIIREYGSNLYVGLAHKVPPTNTKFHRTSYCKSTLTLMGPAKRWKCHSASRQKREFLAILHNNNNNNN